MFFFTRWVDGTPVDYLKWGPGQPDNGYEQEGCVEFHPLDPGNKLNWLDSRWGTQADASP